MSYEPVIGLEVHVQMSTESKIFCTCSNKFGSDPNTNVCPVCLGMPGVLPVLNEKVIEYTVKAGLALNCQIRTKSVFARKNYFYPDLPKAYQISQYELPICEHGYIDIELEDGTQKRIGITRIHIEEDAGKLNHEAGCSLVDLNRTGTPLMEIVSEPDLRSAEEAKAYLMKLKTILEYVEVSDCNMEEGSMRCDANVSIRPDSGAPFGTRAEIKNVNSFKNVERAIKYEQKRQEKVLNEGGKIVQETRLFNADTGITASMRGKEDAHDYRYFPDPDLVPIVLEEKFISGIKAWMPELPDAKRARFMSEYGLSGIDADFLVSAKSYGAYFEQAVKSHYNPKAVCNWVMGELMRRLNDKQCTIFEAGISPENLAEIVKLIDEGKISGNIAKQVFDETAETGKKPSDIVAEKGLVQNSNEDELEAIVKQVLDANPAETERYKNGEAKLQGFFMGQIMKASKGKANPGVVAPLLKKLTS
ncbi:MAG: Asp-tRNA(Asn)/Glu-tRNA(Gln) amidotransferase subunit GatB [Deferribacterales bacterium]